MEASVIFNRSWARKKKENQDQNSRSVRLTPMKKPAKMIWGTPFWVSASRPSLTRFSAISTWKRRWPVARRTQNNGTGSSVQEEGCRGKADGGLQVWRQTEGRASYSRWGGRQWKRRGGSVERPRMNLPKLSRSRGRCQLNRCLGADSPSLSVQYR